MAAEAQTNTQEEKKKPCTCPKNVMKFVGVIPASKTVKAMSDSESDDSMDESLLQPFLAASHRPRHGNRARAEG